jgi:hypothetical protein
MNRRQNRTYAWNHWNETAPEPRGQIFHSIRSYVFVAWFPDLSVAIRIYSLACLYNLKANRNQFSKYFEVYMILKDDCTKPPLLAIEVWSAEVETCNMRLFQPPLRLSNFYGSRDQPRGLSLGRAWERGCRSSYFLKLDAQIDANGISGSLYSKHFPGGGMPPDPIGCLTPSALDYMTTHMTLASPLERRAQMKARLMYISINKLAPHRLSNFFQNSNTVYDYNLRGSSTIN